MKKVLSIFFCAMVVLTVSAQQNFGVIGFVSGNVAYSITGPNTVEVISLQELATCSWYSGAVVVPSTVECNGTTYTVTRIGEKAFDGCAVTRVSLPSTIEEIGRDAFSSTRLQSIALPSSLQSIGIGAFAFCSRLNTIHLPASVSHIGSCAFHSSGITSFTVDSANSHYRVVDGFLCNADTTVLISTPPGKRVDTVFLPATLQRLESWSIGRRTPIAVIMPPNLKEIGEGAIPTSISTLYLPASVCRIEGNPVGEYPPEWLSVVVDSANSHYTFADGRLTSVDGDTLLLVTNASGNYSVPEGVKVLSNELFSGNTDLISVTLPEGLTDIGEGAFFDTRCNVNLPSTLRVIGLQAFMRNTGISEVVVPAGVREISWQAFAESSITSIVLPDSLKIIGKEAFYACQSLTDLQWGSMLEEIHPKAFRITSLDTLPPMPASLKTVGTQAFDGVNGADYVEFLGSPDTIGKSAYNMSEVRFRGEQPPVIFEEAFWHASLVYVPCGCSAAYQAQPGLTNIQIEEDCDGIDGVADEETAVMPNPATNKVRVTSSFGLTRIETYDAKGRLVQTLPASGLKADLDISTWPRGTYLLRIFTPAGPTTKKLLIQ